MHLLTLMSENTSCARVDMIPVGLYSCISFRKRGFTTVTFAKK